MPEPNSLRLLMNEPGLVVAPGAFDAFSTWLIERAGFTAVYMTGYGISASRVGVPDAGLISLGEMVEGVRTLARVTSLPIIADADTGFGNILNVRRTVREYEAAGAAAIQIEDQVFPKRCGHTLGREVIDARAMTKKIEVALESRRHDETLIIARTDAGHPLGFEEAVRRGKLYAETGADIIFVESPGTEEEFARIGGEVPAPTLANMIEGGLSPLLSNARLEALGFKIVIYPATGFLAASRAMRTAFESLKRTGDANAMRTSIDDMQTVHNLVGFPDVDSFLQRHT